MLLTSGGQSSQITLYGSEVKERLTSAYRTVCALLRSFKGAQLVLKTITSAFEAEAEHWLSTRWSIRQADSHGAAPPVSRTNNSSSSSSSNASQFYHADGDATNEMSINGGAWSCIARLYDLLVQRFDARPASFITNASAAADGGLILLSGSDRNAALSERVVINHGIFARRHAYAHWWHRGSLVERLGWLPYWHKVAHLLQALDGYPNASAFVWLDDDIVLTNHGHDMFRRALMRHANASVLVTKDPAYHVGAARVNTGVMIVRADSGAREVLTEMWRRATEWRADGLSLATDPQSLGCLHEQQALQEMLEQPEWRAKVAVLDQRDELEGRRIGGELQADGATSTPFNMNTFLRWSHHNAERDAEMRFDGDAYGSRWRRGDFAGHCSGLSPVRRSLCVSVLLDAVVS